MSTLCLPCHCQNFQLLECAAQYKLLAIDPISHYQQRPLPTHTHTHILPEEGTVVVVPEVGRQLEVGRLEVGQRVGKLEVGQLVGTVQEVGRQGLELVYRPFLF